MRQHGGKDGPARGPRRTHLDVNDVADLERLEVRREGDGAVLAKATREHVARAAAETVRVTHGFWLPEHAGKRAGRSDGAWHGHYRTYAARAPPAPRAAHTQTTTGQGQAMAHREKEQR